MNDKTIIRPATQDDYAAMDRLQTASVRALCAGFYATELIESWVGVPKPERYATGTEKGAAYYVAFRADSMCGFCGITLAHGFVDAVFVHPDAAGQGIGSLMLKHLFALAAHHGVDELQVESSLNAVDFYARHGFVEFERSQVVLTTGQMIDGVLMRRNRQPRDENQLVM